MASSNDPLFINYMDYHPYYAGTNPNHSPGSDSQTLAFLKDTSGKPTVAKNKTSEKDKYLATKRGIY